MEVTPTVRIVLVVDDTEGVVDVVPFASGFEAARECARMVAEYDREIQDFHRSLIARSPAIVAATLKRPATVGT